ncbi:MAG: hypothetical protein FWH23_08000 [Bacteroidales bacterium]|nr:hypothetical protein [Bacteroidales bacterium]
MKKILILGTFVLTTIILFAQQDSTSTIQQIKKQVEVPIYQLFPTENYWTFIKLDTRNGKMWQVHFTISQDGFDGELILNSRALVWTEEEEVNGRFTLYPTKNMYNFILLDQINGKTYQVQWNNDEKKRFVSRIY